MTHKEEQFLLNEVEYLSSRIDELENTIDKIDTRTQQLLAFCNYIVLNSTRENEADFSRNVLANLVSNGINKFNK